MEAGVNAVPERSPLVFRRLAKLDIENAAVWYDGRVAGLGERFIEEVDRCLESITLNPEAYPVVHRETRRALLRRFPFAVFYRWRDQVVTVVACLHTRRAPQRWHRRG